jgi:hypothetical protein
MKEDLSKPKPVESVLWGREIEVPKVIKETLVDGEKIIHAIQQSRFEKMVTPNSIFITTRRVIVHVPTTLGLRRTIQDYKFTDMANTEIRQGFISSDIVIKMRFLSEPVFLKRIPTKVAREMVKTIQKGIDNMLMTSPVANVAKEKEEDDSLTILKKRYAKGEISKKEYLDMRKDLEEED